MVDTTKQDCPECEGLGMVWKYGGPQRTEEGPCPNCEGTGKVKKEDE